MMVPLLLISDQVSQDRIGIKQQLDASWPRPERFGRTSNVLPGRPPAEATILTIVLIRRHHALACFQSSHFNEPCRSRPTAPRKEEFFIDRAQLAST
jgi:hypothetical protein